MPSMIEAWLSASETIRSVSPVIVGMTPVLAVNPDWKREDGLGVLELGELGLERLVERHRPGDRPHGAGARAELLDGLDRRSPHPRVVGQAQVVVRGQADDPRPSTDTIGPCAEDITRSGR